MEREVIDSAISWGTRVYNRQEELAKELNELVDGFKYDLSNPDSIKLRAIVVVSHCLEKAEEEVDLFNRYVENHFDWRGAENIYNAIPNHLV